MVNLQDTCPYKVRGWWMNEVFQHGTLVRIPDWSVSVYLHVPSMSPFLVPLKNAIHMQSHNVKKIKDAACKYGDTDGTCKWAFNVRRRDPPVLNAGALPAAAAATAPVTNRSACFSVIANTEVRHFVKSHGHFSRFYCNFKLFNTASEIFSHKWTKRLCFHQWWNASSGVFREFNQ